MFRYKSAPKASQSNPFKLLQMLTEGGEEYLSKKGNNQRIQGLEFTCAPQTSGAINQIMRIQERAYAHVNNLTKGAA